MKNIFKITTSLFLAISILSCNSKDNKSDLTENTSLITVKSMNDISSKQSVLQKEFKTIKLFKGIKEMKNFTVTEDSILNKKFIQGEGVDENDNYVVFRTEVKIKKLKNGMYGFNLLTDVSESCTGVNCSKCSFAQGGGCECKKVGSAVGGASYCNHSISKEK